MNKLIALLLITTTLIPVFAFASENTCIDAIETHDCYLAFYREHATEGYICSVKGLSLLALILFIILQEYPNQK